MRISKADRIQLVSKELAKMVIEEIPFSADYILDISFFYEVSYQEVLDIYDELSGFDPEAGEF